MRLKWLPDAADGRSCLARFSLMALLVAVFASPLQAGPAVQPMKELDAWDAVKPMGLGVNIGNTLDNTKAWETGWGQPAITQEYIQTLARYGFKTVRLPVAWDSFAIKGRIGEDKLKRVAQIVDWVIAAGMYCVVNIHWDGGWIDSDDKKRFPDTYATFSAEAEQKFKSYWTQIATYLGYQNERLVFEGLNEETNFEGTGSIEQSYATLTRVNQLFIDTVRATGGNNARRLLIIAGYKTDFEKTTSSLYVLPKDSISHRLMLSVHYYTPWAFAGMTEDASYAKVQPTWGSAADIVQLTHLFGILRDFCRQNDIPAFVGEFAASGKKDPASRQIWMEHVARAAVAHKMVPVLWETGGDIMRKPPYYPDRILRDTLIELARPSERFDAPQN